MLCNKLFLKQITGLGELFEKQMTDVLLEIYYQALKDLTDAEFQEAVGKIVMSKTFHKMPLPAEIREAIRGNPEDLAIKAFDVFIQGKARTGPYISVIFEDRTIHAVVQSFGGWEAICLIPENEWRFRRKEWIETYKAMKQRLRSDIPEKLIGLIEAENMQNEDWKEFIPEMVVIGDGKPEPVLIEN